MVKLKFNVFPDEESFNYSFDINETFKKLKKELVENKKIKDEEYYIEINDNIMDNNSIIKDYAVDDGSVISIVRNNYVKIKVEVKNNEGKIETLFSYVPALDFKIIKLDENNLIKVCVNNCVHHFI